LAVFKNGFEALLFFNVKDISGLSKKVNNFKMHRRADGLGPQFVIE